MVELTSLPARRCANAVLADSSMARGVVVRERGGSNAVPANISDPERGAPANIVGHMQVER